MKKANIKQSYSNEIVECGAGDKVAIGTHSDRRTFLKNSGGATAATFLALHGMRIELVAVAGSTGRWWVLATPNTHYSQSAISEVNALIETFSYKITYYCSPVGGQPDAISLTINAEAWYTSEYEDTVITATAVVLSAAIENQNTGAINSSMAPQVSSSVSSSWEEVYSSETTIRRQRMKLTLAPVFSSGNFDASVSGSATLVVEVEEKRKLGILEGGGWTNWEPFSDYPKSSSTPISATAQSQYDPTL